MNVVKRFLGHLNTVNRHRFQVCKMCFKFGIYWQGLTHDLSKYNPVEFFPSVKYYQGGRSPIDAEKEDKGFSMAWVHHHNRNKHHSIYWMDRTNGEMTAVRIPLKYVYELIADSIGAGKVYFKNSGKEWTEKEPFEYWKNVDRKNTWKWLHPETQIVVDMIYIDIVRYGLKKVCEMIKNGYYKKFYSKTGKEQISGMEEYKKIIELYYEK